jgi:hypothetical protein
MKICKYIILAFIFISTLIPGYGQTPMGLYFMETIPQSSQINPAMQPRANGFLALPSVNLGFQSDLAFKDVFQDVGDEWVTPLSQRFNYDDLYNVMGKAANINSNIGADILGFGFRSGRDYFTFTLALKNTMQFGLPSDLFKIAETGFPDGQQFDFSSIRVKEAAYHELAFGYSREWNDKFTFGVKLKPLFGIAGAVTDISRFEINTSRQSWDLMVDGTVHSSAPINVVEGAPGDFPEDIEERDLDDTETRDYFSSLSNGGLSFDFGVVYDHNKDWTFSAALNNLGFVRFKNDLNSLSFNGTYAFEGISVNGTEENAIDNAFEEIGDSLKSVIQYDVDHEKFNIPLTPYMYVGASYQWTPSVSFGILSRSAFQKYNFRQDVSLSANIQPYSFVALNLNYRKGFRGGNGLGSAISVFAGPLQLYLAADYIPTRYANVSFDGGDSVAMPYRHKDLSFRFGLNFIFGRHGYRNEPMLSVN